MPSVAYSMRHPHRVYVGMAQQRRLLTEESKATALIPQAHPLYYLLLHLYHLSSSVLRAWTGRTLESQYLGYTLQLDIPDLK